MDFDFSPEQYMLRDTVRDLLRRECTPADVRAAWDSPTGRSDRRAMTSKPFCSRIRVPLRLSVPSGKMHTTSP